MICKQCDNTITGNMSLCSMCSTEMHTECQSNCVICDEPMCFSCIVKNSYLCKKCSKNRIPINTMEFISSTMFGAYEDCPYFFKLKYIDKVIADEDDVNKYSVIGTLLHDLFEAYCKVRPLDETVLVEMQNKYNTKFGELDRTLFKDDEDYNHFKAIHTQTIINWFEKEKTLNIPLITEKQEFITLHKDLTTIRCTMDRVNGIEGSPKDWNVIDYKTGAVYTSDQLRHNMQMPIYAMAIKHLYGELPKFLTLYFVQHGKERIFERITDDLYTCKVYRGGTYTISLEERLYKMITIYEDIKNNKFPLCTNNDYYCDNFCKAKELGLCKKTKW